MKPTTTILAFASHASKKQQIFVLSRPAMSVTSGERETFIRDVELGESNKTRARSVGQSVAVAAAADSEYEGDGFWDDEHSRIRFRIQNGEGKGGTRIYSAQNTRNPHPPVLPPRAGRARCRACSSDGAGLSKFHAWAANLARPANGRRSVIGIRGEGGGDSGGAGRARRRKSARAAGPFSKRPPEPRSQSLPP